MKQILRNLKPFCKPLATGGRSDTAQQSARPETAPGPGTGTCWVTSQHKLASVPLMYYTDTLYKSRWVTKLTEKRRKRSFGTKDLPQHCWTELNADKRSIYCTLQTKETEIYSPFIKTSCRYTLALTIWIWGRGEGGGTPNAGQGYSTTPQQHIHVHIPTWFHKKDVNISV